MGREYIVREDDLRKLLMCEIKLWSLDVMGVDNWDGYDDAIREGRKKLIEWNLDAKAENEDDLIKYFMKQHTEVKNAK